MLGMESNKRSNDCSETTNPKRKHVSLTILQKVKILEKLDSGVSPRDVSETFGISVRAVYDIRKSKEKLLKFHAETCSNKELANRKTLHGARCADSDGLVYEWFKKRRSLGLPTTGVALREKAKQIHKDLKLEGKCSFTSGWLRQFKRRHGILCLRGECIEKNSNKDRTECDKDDAEEFIEKFSKLVLDENLSPEQIYNFGVTELFWQCLPVKATHRENAPEKIKELNEKLSVLLCSNSAGTHKCKPLLIGEIVHPQSLKNIVSLPVIYKYNKKSYLSKELIIDWFKNNFVKEAQNHCQKAGLADDCKILLLLDNLRSFPNVETLISNNVKCLFLPQNTVALIQPMNQGIISSWKCHYRANCLRRILDADLLLHSLAFYKHNFDLRAAINMMIKAWNSVSKITLKNAWYDLWPSSVFFDSEDEDYDFEDFGLTEVEKEASELLSYAKGKKSYLSKVFQQDAIINWLSSEDDIPYGKQADSNGEIMSNILNSLPIDSGDDLDCEGEKITFNQGLQLGEKYLKFLERQCCVTQQERMTVYRLQKKLRREKLQVLKQPTIESVLVFTEPKYTVN